jgi:hypothetical protein
MRTAARARDDDEGAVRLRYADRLALAAVGVRRPERATVLTPALDPVPAGRTRVVGPLEGCDDEVAGPDRGDVVTDLLDDPDELVAEP